MSDMDFYTNPMSRGQIARWALHEVGAQYNQHLLAYGDTGKGGMKSPEYLAINPMGKVPAIVHNGQVVTECPAICAYLAEAFPDAGLAPKPQELADYYRWFCFTAGPLEAAVTAQAMGWEVPEGKDAMAGFGTYDRTVDTLAAHLGAHDYVCGERFTMADVYVGAQVIWGAQFGTLPARDEFAQYAKRLAERDNYQSAKEIDAKLIAEAELATQS